MRPFTIAVFALALLIALPPTTRAQGIANSLHELRLLVRPGETVTVVDGTGREVRGRIESLSASQIVLGTPQGPQKWGDGDLRSIRQRRGDSLGNGALIGMGVGGGLALTAGLLLVEEEDEAGWVAGATLVYAGLGAAIGLGIDALITREYVIYEPTGKPAARLRVSPLLNHDAQGVRVTLSF